MCPLVLRAKNVSTPPTGATAGAAVSTPPRLVQGVVTFGSAVPEDGTDAVLYHSALLVPRQATVSVLPVMTAAGPPVHGIDAEPSRAQPVFSDRMYSCVLLEVATNSGCAGALAYAMGAAATAGGATSVPPSECQPPPRCGACTHSCACGPSTPTATATG